VVNIITIGLSASKPFTSKGKRKRFGVSLLRGCAEGTLFDGAEASLRDSR
jgi:hypothetical protein